MEGVCARDKKKKKKKEDVMVLLALLTACSYILHAISPRVSLLPGQTGKNE